MGTKQSTPSTDDGDSATFPIDGAKNKETPEKTGAGSIAHTITESSSDGGEREMNGARRGLRSEKMSPSHPVTGHNAEVEVNRPTVKENEELKSKFSPSSYISDNDVHVNLAMADLMAYLQVVADNSNNLPLTRRDDPELSKTVSTLTADEYAKKSAAFVPSDIRVIGGSFLRYGRVWDLPTSDEFDVVDGAQEPGRSYGGACCNAMLKVLYDLESEASDHVIKQTMTPGSLFEDDEESMLGTPSMERNRTFESLVLGDTSPSTITWATLLRKMKAEMQEIEYPQAPAITSSRKFDLNTPFSLIPPGFDPSKGQKRSLLIGCKYTNIEGAELKASHDDVRSMKDYIVNVHGFPESKSLMTVLLDDDNHKHPTHMNITEAFKTLSEESRPGDTVFVMFSGHGGRVLDSPIDDQVESYDETIVPSDFQTSGLIRDTLMFKTLLAPMRSGVTVTIIIDSCDTGMMLDLPYAWSTKSDHGETLAKMSLNDDFSFVRFLKVVKTLYESSVFTQLGKTVGSALNYQPVTSRDDTELDAVTGDEDTVEENSVADDQTQKAVPESSGILCFGFPKSSNTGCQDVADTILSGKEKPNQMDMPSVDTRDKRMPPQSLLEQVMNCTLLGHGEEDSDDDTFRVPSYDDGTVGDATTFDTDFDNESRGRRGNSKRRGRK